jgi:hypothetical protein
MGNHQYKPIKEYTKVNLSIKSTTYNKTQFFIDQQSLAKIITYNFSNVSQTWNQIAQAQKNKHTGLVLSHTLFKRNPLRKYPPKLQHLMLSKLIPILLPSIQYTFGKNFFLDIRGIPVSFYDLYLTWHHSL